MKYINLYILSFLRIISVANFQSVQSSEGNEWLTSRWVADCWIWAPVTGKDHWGLAAVWGRPPWVASADCSPPSLLPIPRTFPVLKIARFHIISQYYEWSEQVTMTNSEDANHVWPLKCISAGMRGSFDNGSLIIAAILSSRIIVKQYEKSRLIACQNAKWN